MRLKKHLLALLVVALLSATQVYAFQLQPRLPNGLVLEPAGPTYDVGNMPLSAGLSPDGKIVMLLGGFRQQGLQIFDPKTNTVTQTISQPSAFYGFASASNDGTLYTSGGGDDVLYIYRWKDGSAELQGKINLQQQPEQKEKKIVRYPAGIAISADNQYLYVAENVSDTLAIVDIKSGAVIDRKPAGRYPFAIVAGPGKSLFVSSWGGNTVTRFRLDPSGRKVLRADNIVVNRHPSALLLNRKGSRLFVASGSTDTIAVVDTATLRVIRTLRDAVPANTQEGSTPNALALSPDDKTLYVAEADSNTVAVFQLSRASSGQLRGPAQDRLLGRIPVGWYPTALLINEAHLYVVNAKGRGTRANPNATQGYAYIRTPTDYTLGQLNGTITVLPSEFNEEQLKQHSETVARLNNWSALPVKKQSYPPFKHVLYIIKENRTYDQVFGDVKEGDGDASLVFFPETASPNHRDLARRFGLFDRFFVNAEVSSQGHPWSTSAYVTDFTEKTVHSTYSSRREDESPEDDVSEPAAGYLWDLADRAKKSLRVYGEYAEPSADGQLYRSTKKGASAYTSPTYPSYNLEISDQKRADAWLAEFKSFVAKGDMPALQIFHLPNDHTAGSKAGMGTPAAYFADNDLALGRIIEALSNSQFWKDTVVFVVEDDSQSGPDHVDSHRSVLLVVSAYNRAGVQHRFTNTTDVIATVEQILNLGSLSQFDHYGRPLADIFSSQADLTPYQAIRPAQSLEEKNPEGKSATSSLRLKLEKPDLSDDDVFNRILWAAIKGEQAPYPGIQHISLQELERDR